MKKMSLILMLAIVFCLTVLGSARAADYTWSENSLQVGTTTTTVLPVSKGVSVYYRNHIQGNIADSYTMATYHSAGNRTVASGSTQQKLFYQDTLQVTPPAAPAAGDDPATLYASPWKPM